MEAEYIVSPIHRDEVISISISMKAAFTKALESIVNDEHDALKLVLSLPGVKQWRCILKKTKVKLDGKYKDVILVSKFRSGAWSNLTDIITLESLRNGKLHVG